MLVADVQDSKIETPGSCITKNQVEELRENGILTVDHFLPSSMADKMLTTSQRLNAMGKLRPARMNRDDKRWQEKSIRGDKIVWITSMDKNTVPPIFMKFFCCLRNLRRQLQNGAPELSLGNKISMQLANYPGAARYARHFDAFTP